jgi:hypothetical protein
MSPPEREPDPNEAPDASDASGAATDPEGDDVSALQAAGDLDGLLALAKTYRAKREMSACLAAYRAAAELGSPEAEFAAALFYLSGGVVPQDLKEGAARLRSAADKGSIPARVYLGNLYELGIHYKADPEKADVWYRNAARAAKIEDEPGTDEHARALAELGCARYALALVESGAATGDDKTRLLARAKIHGYGLRVRGEGDEGERLTFTEALAGVDPQTGGAGVAKSGASSVAPPEGDAVAPGRRPADKPMRERANTMPATPEAKAATEPSADSKDRAKRAQGGSRATAGLAAFGYAMLFAVAGLGAAYAATLGARELVAQGHSLPVVGTRTDLVFAIVLGIVGVLPSWLVYRLGAVLKAVVAGGALGGIGFVAWGTGEGALLATRDLQGLAFGLAGFLATLLVLGLLGGTKLDKSRKSRAAT